MFPYKRLPGHITGLYVFSVVNFLLLCHMTLVQGDITVMSMETNQTVYDKIPDMPAYFGEPIPDAGILGQVVYANPPNACSPIDGPPNSTAVGLTGLKWIVLIKRNDCSFSQKVLNAQRAGYDAAIVHNVDSDQLEPMGPSQGKVIEIPSVFIGEMNGLIIRRLYTYDKGCFVLIDNEIPDIFWPFSLDRYLLPFAVLLAMCFMATISTLIFKCIRDRRHRMRHRLPTRLLKKLPIQKFKRGDQYDVCAICLEDYKEGEKLRVLPCSHTYHTKCIDPWLTENRRICPVCKRKVLLGIDRTAHRPSDTDSEEDDDEDDGNIAPNESTPLLNPSSVTTATRGRSGDPAAAEPGVEQQSDRNPDPANNDSEDVDSRYRRTTTLSVCSTTSSQDGVYQSFATPACSPGTGGAAADTRMLALPVVIVGHDLVSSSGARSVNGEYVDFSPITQQKEASQGPVEIAIDVAAKQQWQVNDSRGPSSSSSSSHVMVV